MGYEPIYDIPYVKGSRYNKDLSVTLIIPVLIIMFLASDAMISYDKDCRFFDYLLHARKWSSVLFRVAIAKTVLGKLWPLGQIRQEKLSIIFPSPPHLKGQALRVLGHFENHKDHKITIMKKQYATPPLAAEKTRGLQVNFVPLRDFAGRLGWGRH